MKKTIIISSVSLFVGILLTLFGYFVYTVIRMQNQIVSHSVAIEQIVKFLNDQIAKSNPQVTQEEIKK